MARHIAKHFKEIYFGGSWTGVNLKDVLSDVTLEEALEKVHSFNTIAVLANHIHYYVKAATDVLEGRPLNAKDELSFDHPPYDSQLQWEQQLDTMWGEAEKFENLIQNVPDGELDEYFSQEKYGNYFRNLAGIVEHTNYHLGQIVLIKLILRGRKS